VSLKDKLEEAFYKSIAFGSFCVFYSRQTRRHNIILKEINNKLKLFDKEYISFSILFISWCGSGGERK